MKKNKTLFIAATLLLAFGMGQPRAFSGPRQEQPAKYFVVSHEPLPTHSLVISFNGAPFNTTASVPPSSMGVGKKIQPPPDDDSRTLRGTSAAIKNINTGSGDLLVGGLIFPGSSPMPAASMTTFATTMQITQSLGAGVQVQLAPNNNTEGVSLNYSPTDNLTVSANIDRKLSGASVGSYADSDFGLGGIDGNNNTQLDYGFSAEFHVPIGPAN